jgi:PH (Pleckstrin Homology) domain-containing protein
MPIYQGELCPICGENPNITYICDDCHDYFCEDCVDIKAEESLICFHCGEKEISADKHGALYCEKCKSDEIRSVKKLIPTCRNCEKQNVHRIEDKQKELFNSYKDVISETRNYLKPLNEILSKLNHYRTSLYQLREDVPECNHFPNLESDILILFKLFDSSKSSIYDKTNRYFQEIQRNINYIAEISITHPSNFQFIEEIICHFKTEYEKILKTVKNTIEPLEKRSIQVQEKIEFMEIVQNMFNGFLTKLKLDDDEKIVFSIKCKLATSTSQQKDYSNKNGTILITSKRVYFFHEQGVFKKKTVMLFSVLIEDLQNVQVKGRLKKRVSLDFINSMYKFTISKQNRLKMVKWIENARTFDVKNQIDKIQLKKLGKYRITTKLFNEELENAIYELIGFHGSQSNPNYQYTPNIPNQRINQDMYRTSHMSSTKPTNTTSVHRYPGQNFTQANSPSHFRGRPSGSLSHLRSFPKTNNNSRNRNTSTTFSTPSGHFGYPHDRPIVQDNLNDPNRTYGPNSYNPRSPYGPGPIAQPTNSPGMMNNSRNSYNNVNGNRISAQNSSNPFNQQLNNQEIGYRQQINTLKQDEFALNQTLQMLEQRYDGGYINNVEFVKNYKELQRDIYKVRLNLQQLEAYVQENYDLANN